MQITERRKRILNIFLEKGSLSFREILDESSGLGEPIDILCDIDTLIFFRFLQHSKDIRKSKNETVIEMRPNTEKKMKNDFPRIISRLKDLEREFPPWYRKYAILDVLTSEKMDSDEIVRIIHEKFPHVRWNPLLIEASLRILKKHDYVTTDNRNLEMYTRTPKGKKLLKKPPFQQFLSLRVLKDEFNTEFRTCIILNLVRDYNSSGISSGRIARCLQLEYGIRRNRRQAIKNTLDNMVIAGLLSVLGGTKNREGHVYRLGKIAESLFFP